MLNTLLSTMINFLIYYGNLILFPLMIVSFLGAIVFKVAAFVTLNYELLFVRHFAKKVQKYLEDTAQRPQVEDANDNQFSNKIYEILNITYNELYELKAKFQRRRFDRISSMADRLFLVRDASKRLIEDTHKQVQFVNHMKHEPSFEETADYIIRTNPLYNRLFGYFNLPKVEEVLNYLPNMLIVLGIFGTFVGIMQALPELGQANAFDQEGASSIVSSFINNIAFSMNTSIVAIFCSVILNVVYSIFNTDYVFTQIVTRYKNSLHLVWQRQSASKAKTKKKAISKKPSKAVSEKSHIRPVLSLKKSEHLKKVS